MIQTIDFHGYFEYRCVVYMNDYPEIECGDVFPRDPELGIFGAASFATGLYDLCVYPISSLHDGDNPSRFWGTHTTGAQQRAGTWDWTSVGRM